MLEVEAHKYLKKYYQNTLVQWPHNLTLTRLISRSLSGKDNTFIQLSRDSKNFWWPGLLIPLCLQNKKIALILSKNQHRQLIEHELPKLKNTQLLFDYVEGILKTSVNEKIWVLSYKDLIYANEKRLLKNRQLIFPESDLISKELRESMSIIITPTDWEYLIHSHLNFEASIREVYERLNCRIISQLVNHNSFVRIDNREILILKEILKDDLEISPKWKRAFNVINNEWVIWAKLDSQILSWSLYFQPLTPFQTLSDLFLKNTLLILTNSVENSSLLLDLDRIKISFTLKVRLGNTLNQEAIPLFVPKRQPLPNTSSFYRYGLRQCHRLILGRTRITIILVDDLQLRLQLTSELAGAFGLRVVHEAIDVETNGIICCSCDWWISNQKNLPIPDQLIFILIPFPTLESPWIAAKVEMFKQQGRDWFREFLLPETLSILFKSVSVIRGKDVRVAILDGRMRYRSWGKLIFQALEPWIALERLLPY